MASKGSGKSGEELVGQALARSLWSQGLTEEEAGRKKFGPMCLCCFNKRISLSESKTVRTCCVYILERTFLSNLARCAMR